MENGASICHKILAPNPTSLLAVSPGVDQAATCPDTRTETMKVPRLYQLLGVFLFLILSGGSTLGAERAEFEEFMRRFMADFSGPGSQPDKVARGYFASAPVFFVGEMPGLSESPEIAAAMLKLFREQFHVLSHPFSAYEIETLAIGHDGSAAMLVAFRRDPGTGPAMGNFCNIFSLARLGGRWKIIGWSLFGLGSAPDCSHQH